MYWVPDGRAAAGLAQAGGGACCAVCCRRVRENSVPGGEAHVAWHPSLWGWRQRWWNKAPASLSGSCSACQASPRCTQPARRCSPASSEAGGDETMRSSDAAGFHGDVCHFTPPHTYTHTDEKEEARMRQPPSNTALRRCRSDSEGRGALPLDAFLALTMRH